MFDKRLIALRLVPQSDNLEFFRQPVVQKEIIKGRNQLAPGQVAANAEDNKDR